MLCVQQKIFCMLQIDFTNAFKFLNRFPSDTPKMNSVQ